MTSVPLGPGSGVICWPNLPTGMVECQSVVVLQDEGRALRVSFQRADGSRVVEFRLVGQDAEGMLAGALEEGFEVFRRAVDALEVCNTIAQQGWRGDAELPDGRILSDVVASVTGGAVNG